MTRVKTGHPQSNLPLPQRNLSFQGRTEQLAEIHQVLFDEKKDRLCVLFGLPGIGKTQIAIEYLYQHLEHYQYIFWADASHPATLMTTFKQFAGSMDIPYFRRRKSTQFLAEIHRWMQTHSDWLLILDNVPSEAFLHNVQEKESFSRILPSMRGGHILITTRVHTGWYGSLQIPALSQEEALNLLLSSSERGGLPVKGEMSAPLDQIVTDLAGLPLAVNQMGQWIRERQWNLDDLIEDYWSVKPLLLATRGPAHMGHAESCLEALISELSDLQREAPAAADLIKFSSQLALAPIPEALIQSGMADKLPALQTAEVRFFINDLFMKPLLRHCMITRRPEEKTIVVHPLMTSAVASTMPRRSQAQWAALACQAIERSMNAEQEQAILQQLGPHRARCQSNTNLQFWESGLS